jgi:hypothetical protein
VNISDNLFWGGFLKNFLVVLALLLISSSVLAAVLKAPNQVDVSAENQSFEVKVENTSDQAQIFGLEFFAPSSYSLSTVPDTIAPNAKLNITVTLDHDPDLAGQEYTSLLRVRMGDTYSSKDITLTYHDLATVLPDNGAGQDNSGQDSQTGQGNQSPASPGTGFFILPSLGLGLDPSTEIVVDIVLILIAALLLIAFIARLTKRLRGVY